MVRLLLVVVIHLLLLVKLLLLVVWVVGLLLQLLEGKMLRLWVELLALVVVVELVLVLDSLLLPHQVRHRLLQNSLGGAFDDVHGLHHHHCIGGSRAHL
jgi:hypothetical protein